MPDADISKHTQADTSTRRQMQADPGRLKQTQADASRQRAQTRVLLVTRHELNQSVTMSTIGTTNREATWRIKSNYTQSSMNINGDRGGRESAMNYERE